MNLEFSSEQLKAEAQRLGFSACGVARACPVDEATARCYRDWIERLNNFLKFRTTIKCQSNPLGRSPGCLGLSQGLGSPIIHTLDLCAVRPPKENHSSVELT